MKEIMAPPQRLDEFIEAFELARARQDVLDLEEFVPQADHPDYCQAVVELIRVDLEYGWRNGPRRTIADYRSRFPDVLADQNRLQQVAYEEYRLRRAGGENVSREEYLRRYDVPTADWPELPVGEAEAEGAHCERQQFDATGALAEDPASAARLAAATRQLPKVGDRFLDFELIGELGRGAFGRVYLARQGDLASRFVALKVTAHLSDEPQQLAQLQHSNIMPIYSLHQRGQLQAVCMPFFGATTLADALRTFQDGCAPPASGQALVVTLSARQASTVGAAAAGGAESPASDAGPARPGRGGQAVSPLGAMSYSDAAAWIMARVADGLAHAHEHGILHRDLKPANILLSDDGEPLILDFNLAASHFAGGPSSAVCGGTLPYMAPEQIQALCDGGEVGPSSDIYSFGVILFELLTGQAPYPVRRGSFTELTSRMLTDRRRPAPGVRSRNKAVSPGLESIVQCCLAPNPNDRYPTARILHEDLQRHLHDLPLRHAANRSLGERARKWTRRHPRLSSSASIAALAAVLILVLGASWWIRGVHISRAQASDAWRRFQLQLARARTALNTPYTGQTALDEAVESAEQALEHYRLLDSAALDQSPDYRRLGDSARRQLRLDAAEMLYLLAGGKGQQAVRRTGAERAAALQQALQFNQRAQDVHSSRSASSSLLMQRARLLEIAGQPEPARMLRERAGRAPLGDDWHDLRLLAVEASQRRDSERATQLLDDLIQRSPQDYSLWFSLGNCHLDLQRFAAAEECFTMAVALRPEFTLGYDHRGLARLHLERHTQARDDFDIVLARRPDLTSSLVNRGLAHQALGQPEQAIRDLTAALKLGARQTRIYFIRARLKSALGDEEGAAADRRNGLRLTPSDELSWIARGIARLPNDAEGALDDFRQALAINPRSRAAWQNIAHVLAELLGRTQEGLAAMDEIVSLAPHDAGALAARGVLLARLGRREAAVADAESARQMTDQPLLIYQIGCIYAITSRQAKEDVGPAVELVARALSKDASLVDIAARDEDLAPLRDGQGLRRILSAAQTVHQASGDRNGR